MLKKQEEEGENGREEEEEEEESGPTSYEYTCNTFPKEVLCDGRSVRRCPLTRVVNRLATMGSQSYRNNDQLSICHSSDSRRETGFSSECKTNRATPFSLFSCSVPTSNVLFRYTFFSSLCLHRYSIHQFRRLRRYTLLKRCREYETIQVESAYFTTCAFYNNSSL